VGHLIHIDFGFIYDWTPGKDTKFEAADFKLPQEYIDILGGNTNHPDFRRFEHKLIQGYLAVRRHSNEFVALTELM
jgi:phosphatidylinositol kinase/protein kinase (PI-3  family)